MKASEWAFHRIKEAFELVAQGARQNRRALCKRSCIIAPAAGQGGFMMSYLCPHCNSFPMEDYVWWVSGENTCQVVVRNLWTEVRLEATKQAFSLANCGKF